MSQGQLHAWDCPCGTRNTPAHPRCRRCTGSQRQGRKVWREAPPPPLEAPVFHLGAALLALAHWCETLITFAGFFANLSGGRRR